MSWRSIEAAKDGSIEQIGCYRGLFSLRSRISLADADRQAIQQDDH